MYNAISANRWKTIALMVVFSALVCGVGWAYGVWSGDLYGGLMFAGLFSLATNIGSYFWSDKIALLSTGAKIVISQEQAPTLWRTVENLAITAGMSMPRVGIIHDLAPNAFATGRNEKHATIVVTTGLLELLNQNELEGVISHELAHIKNNDILLMTMAVVLVGALSLLANMRFYGSRDNERSSGPMAIVAIALMILAPLIGELMKLAISRQREYLADASGALLTRYPEGLASALEKISAQGASVSSATHATAHLFIANPLRESKIASLFSTHPPTEERVARLRNMI